MRLLQKKSVRSNLYKGPIFEPEKEQLQRGIHNQEYFDRLMPTKDSNNGRILRKENSIDGPLILLSRKWLT